MSGDRFTNLALLSLENEGVSSIDLSDVRKDSLENKSRGVPS
jgi:hypothetical protein